MSEQCGWAGLGGMGSGACQSPVFCEKGLLLACLSSTGLHTAGLAEQLRKTCQERGLPAPYVWNRTLSKADPLKAAGCKVADSPAELAQHCSIIFMMLASDAVAESVFSDIAAARKDKGLIVADCSTNAPPTAAKLESAGQTSQPTITYLACPVFGRPDAVRYMKLSFSCNSSENQLADQS